MLKPSRNIKLNLSSSKNIKAKTLSLYLNKSNLNIAAMIEYRV